MKAHSSLRFRLLLLVIMACALLAMSPALAIAKTKTALTASLSSSLEHYEAAPKLTGTLKTSSGRALKGKTVYLYRNGSKIGSKTTNSSGKVAWYVRTPNDADTASWKMSYKGSSKYRASTSKTKSTRVHYHFDGPVTLEGIDVEGTMVYLGDVFLSLTKGHKYQMLCSKPMGFEVYYGAEDSPRQSSGDAEVTSFKIAPTTTGVHDLFYFSLDQTSTIDAVVW